MNQARGAQEPTMEEILSSIRRIISEDGKRGGDLAEPSAPEEPAPQAAPVATLRAVSTAEPSELDAADDVLELTEIAPDESAEPEPLELVEEAEAPALAEPELPPAPTLPPPPEPEAPPSIAAPKAVSPQMEPVPEPAPAPVPPPAHANLAPMPELEPEPEPEASPRLEPQREPEPEIEIRAEVEPEADVENNIEPLEISVSAREPEPEPQLMRVSRLMSEATEIASSAALSVLAQVVQPGRGFTEEGRRMVDQIVRERLEVHLRDWMDAHLPTLVEQIVREEIAGLVERSLGRRS
jgi:cell pole-organizing protein PopZ